MSTTKVTDSVRDTTAIDGTKINAVDAAKLTGNIADARIPASAVTQHVTAFDPATLEMNIAILAFKVASANQLAKFSMVDQVVDEYQDATGIDASASTNEVAGGATTAKYYSGGTNTTLTPTQDADATGTDGDYTWYKWTDTASTGSYSVSASETIEYLIVAGGGSGSGGNHGGGGAGGLIATTGVSYTASSTWTITVGAGGAAASGNTVGNSGANSILSGSGLSTQTAIGGGRGGHGGIGLVGGSGGGNSYNATGTPAAGTAGQGNAGGSANTSGPHSGAAGGGGAGGVGVNGTSSANPRSGGDGGIGLQNDITGTNLYYAGGGGGSTDGNVTDAGNGGLGGGGHGDGVSGSSTQAEKDGDANTGGGGGAGHWHGSGTSGAGGSGVVIIRRPTVTTTISNLTLQSTATTAESAPTTADLVVLIEDGAGTATVNTDIKGYVSRDGSAFSTAVTFVDEGDWGTNKRILVARNIDISGIATGTAMKYKLTSHNQSAGSKETRIHATSLAWA